MLEGWKRRAKELKREVYAIYFACRDARVPWYAKALAAGVVAYAFSPIDLIPDFIPVLGYLDELVILPLGILAVRAMIPAAVMEECRQRALSLESKPKSWIAAAIFVAIWLAISAAAIYWAVAYFAPNLAQGQKVYAEHCASCHGAKLEGQANWRMKLPNGRMPAPPHDDSGHTWHHPDDVLFGITKNGLVPPYAPPGYQSDMPAFAGKLSDAEIRAVLAYIASHWSDEVRKVRAEMLRR
jgi:uncharacterized membrane protein YkvA (DUF1232 family)/mono/diheme cytochrome c family protein